MAFKDQARNSSNNDNFGNFLTNGKLICRFASWNDPTLFRPFGEPTSDGQGIKPWLNGVDDPEDYSEWCTLLLKVIRGCGTDRRITFFDAPSDMDGGETPYGLILRRVQALAKQNPIYKDLLQGKAGAGAAVPRPGNLVAMQGVLLEHSGRDYSEEPKHAMLVLPPSASDRLRDLLLEENPNFDPRGPLEQRFASGDVVHPETGKLIRIFNPEKQRANTANINFNRIGSAGGFQKGASQKTKEFKAYEVEFQPSPPVDAAAMVSMFVSWKETLNWLTTAQQVQELSSCYRPELIAQVFRDSLFEQHVPGNIRDKYFGSGNVVQGFTAPGGEPNVAPPPAQRNPFKGLGSATGSPPSNPPAGMPMPNSAPPQQVQSEQQTASAPSAEAGKFKFGNTKRATEDEPSEEGQPRTAAAFTAPPAANPAVQSSVDRLRSLMEGGNQDQGE
jgi:hypothetical protein